MMEYFKQFDDDAKSESSIMGQKQEMPAII